MAKEIPILKFFYACKKIELFPIFCILLALWQLFQIIFFDIFTVVEHFITYHFFFQEHLRLKIWGWKFPKNRNTQAGQEKECLWEKCTIWVHNEDCFSIAIIAKTLKTHLKTIYYSAYKWPKIYQPAWPQNRGSFEIIEVTTLSLHKRFCLRKLK